MSQKILQINFKFSVSKNEYEQAVTPLASPIADVSGLRWKVWIMNEEEQEAGGLYLFSDSASLDAYLGSPIVAGILKHPALSDFSVKQFDILENVTAITSGPV
jgi:hypothetical protein